VKNKAKNKAKSKENGWNHRDFDGHTIRYLSVASELYRRVIVLTRGCKWWLCHKEQSAQYLFEPS
jgi:hypothetical protein